MKPTQKLVNAIQNYYFNRQRAQQHIAKWNKEVDLQAIEDAAGKLNFTACAGTFWFEYATSKHIVSFEINEKTFPKFQKSKRVKKSTL